MLDIERSETKEPDVLARTALLIFALFRRGRIRLGAFHDVGGLCVRGAVAACASLVEAVAGVTGTPRIASDHGHRRSNA
jgi:hypothetical protein